MGGLVMRGILINITIAIVLIPLAAKLVLFLVAMASS